MTTRKSNKKHKRKKASSWKHFLVNLLLFFISLFLVGVIVLGGVFFYYAKDAPKLDNTKLVDKVSTRFLNDKGEVLDEIGAEKRIMISAKEVPTLLNDAVVSVEDKRFYKHVGIDPIRIVGSALGNFKAGKVTGGGSTLTQQLIKLSYFSTKKEDQTLKRKAQEAYLALKLEREKTKEEILTLYVNKVYMANGIYGMGTAAKTYYGKEIKDLTLPQIALLAGLPNAPNAYDPYVHEKAAKQRRDTVLYTMLDNKKITQKEYDAAVKTDVKEGLVKLNATTGNRKYLDNYLTSAMEEVKEKTGKDPYKEGMDIYLNVDLNQQKALYDIINHDKSIPFPDDKIQAASTVMDPTTGKVVAQIGGRNIPENVQFGINRATNSGENGRDVGSTMKPLIDYGPAFEYLNYSTGKYVVDAPYQYPGTDLNVHNYDNSYLGTITVRKALIDSRNVPAVKTLMEVGTTKAGEFLKKIGIHLDKIQGGTAISAPLSTEELAGGYGAFANNGLYTKPSYVNKVVYQDNTEEVFSPQTKRAMKPSTAYMMTDILKDVVKKGTGYSAYIPNLIQAGKTGTSNYDESVKDKIIGEKTGVPDVNFVGYTKNYVMAVWCGYDNYLQAVPYYTHHDLAALVYKAMMEKLAKDVPNEDWEMPKDVVNVGGELYPKGQEPVIKKYVPNSSYKAPLPSSTVEQKETEKNTLESTTPETSESVEKVPESTTPSTTVPIPETTPSKEEQPKEEEKEEVKPPLPPEQSQSNLSKTNQKTLKKTIKKAS